MLRFAVSCLMSSSFLTVLRYALASIFRKGWQKSALSRVISKDVGMIWWLVLTLFVSRLWHQENYETLVLFAGTIISRSILDNRGHSHVPVFDYTSVGRWWRIFHHGTWSIKSTIKFQLMVKCNKWWILNHMWYHVVPIFWVSPIYSICDSVFLQHHSHMNELLLFN